jgi:hypothetical protein
MVHQPVHTVRRQRSGARDFGNGLCFPEGLIDLHLAAPENFNKTLS